MKKYTLGDYTEQEWKDSFSFGGEDLNTFPLIRDSGALITAGVKEFGDDIARLRAIQAVLFDLLDETRNESTMDKINDKIDSIFKDIKDTKMALEEKELETRTEYKDGEVIPLTEKTFNKLVKSLKLEASEIRNNYIKGEIFEDDTAHEDRNNRNEKNPQQSGQALIQAEILEEILSKAKEGSETIPWAPEPSKGKKSISEKKKFGEERV